MIFFFNGFDANTSWNWKEKNFYKWACKITNSYPEILNNKKINKIIRVPATINEISYHH